MSSSNIFISVGRTATEKQETFVRGVEDRLRSEGFNPATVGRNKFTADAPLKGIITCMSESSGAVIIALERTYFPKGLDKRDGPHESPLTEVKYATPWNQIEAGIAYSKGLPILVIVEDGLRSEGLLEHGYDWYVLRIKPETSALNTAEFNGVLASWKEKVGRFEKTALQQTSAGQDPASMNLGELIKNLKPSSLWGILVALATLIGGAFALGQVFGEAN